MISGYIIVWFFVFALTILVIKNKGYKGIKKSGVFAGNQAISIGRKMPFALLSAAFIAQIVPIEELSQYCWARVWLIGYNYKCFIGWSSAWRPDDLISNSFNFLCWRSRCSSDCCFDIWMVNFCYPPRFGF